MRARRYVTPAYRRPDTLRVVFLGTPAFAIPSLRALAAQPDISVPLVITQPDRVAGRGMRLAAPPIKAVAEELGLALAQPETLRDAAAVDALRSARPDLLVVVAYGELLRRAALDAAPHGALNVHPSLLPRHRGASPIPAAILHGDATTGVSIIRLIRRMDAGPIVAQREVDILPADTAGSLAERLAGVAAEMLPDVCRGWAAGMLDSREQDDAQATYAPEWSKDDARIDWSAPAARLERLVRAAQPWPVAWTLVGDQRLRVLRAAARPDEGVDGARPGDVRLVDARVVARAGAGALELLVVQPSGKRAMPAADWWRGLRGSGVHLG